MGASVCSSVGVEASFVAVENIWLLGCVGVDVSPWRDSFKCSRPVCGIRDCFTLRLISFYVRCQISVYEKSPLSETCTKKVFMRSGKEN